MTTAIAATVAAAAFAQTPAPARSPSPDGIASVRCRRGRPTTSPARVWRTASGSAIPRPAAETRARGPVRVACMRRDKGGATVWRAGANVLTRPHRSIARRSEARRFRLGEHSDLHRHEGPTGRSSFRHSRRRRPTTPTRSKVWEAFVYTPEKDVTRAPMRVERLPYSIEQLTYAFTDVTGTAGTLRLMWTR